MANWIKIMTTLPRSRAVFALARALKCKRHAALGLAVEWLCWLDENSADGETGMLDAEISDMLGWQGAAEALSSIGWISHGEDGCVVAVDFEGHNGESAKKRAMDAKRKERERYRKCHDGGVTNVTLAPRPDKKRVYVDEGCRVSNSMLAQPQAMPAHPRIFPKTEEERAWMVAVSAAHPTMNPDRAMPQDVQDAAADAFERYPDAMEHAELLTAFMRAKVDYRGDKERFYRPVGQRQFFVDLEDTVAHALRWAKFAGWKPRQPKQRMEPPAPTPQGEQQPQMTDEEIHAFFHDKEGTADG